jgi:hypothetical protein
MSQLKVTSLETTTLTTNVVTASQTTINSTGLFIGSNVAVTNNTITANSAAGSVVLSPTINTTSIVIGNTNVFPNSNDIYAWAAGAVLFNVNHSRDYSIERSPFGGIPYKLEPTGVDPYPSTYNTNTWNLALTSPNDVWKVSGYIRANTDITINDFSYLLILPTNTSGGYGTSGTAGGLPNVNLTKNVWQYFEGSVSVSGNANTFYLQIRPDGEQSGSATIWYDGLKIERAYTNIPSETVNTQIFTSNGIYVKPSWANTGNELIIVHLWGGGGGYGGNTAVIRGGGGGAFVFGYFKSSTVNSVCNVVVGTGGAAITINASSNIGNPGGTSTFWPNTTIGLSAYGGGPGGNFLNGGGGGWLSVGGTGTGGAPLPGSNSTGSSESTFGGGVTNTTTSGTSVYGGGSGGRTLIGGPSVYGGGGGATGNSIGSSVYGGDGGNLVIYPSTPGGGSGGLGDGANGEVRIYTLKYTGL